MTDFKNPEYSPSWLQLQEASSASASEGVSDGSKGGVRGSASSSSALRGLLLYPNISLIAHNLGISTSKVRFYEEQFAFPIYRKGTGGGRSVNGRKYTKKVADLIAQAHYLTGTVGMTIPGARQAIRGGYAEDFINIYKSKSSKNEQSK